MNETLAELLEETAQYEIDSQKRVRLGQEILEASGVTNMNQLATFVEVLAYNAAVENGAHGDEETAEALFGNASTIANALRKLHDLIQEMA